MIRQVPIYSRPSVVERLLLRLDLILVVLQLTLLREIVFLLQVVAVLRHQRPECPRNDARVLARHRDLQHLRTDDPDGERRYERRVDLVVEPRRRRTLRRQPTRQRRTPADGDPEAT